MNPVLQTRMADQRGAAPDAKYWPRYRLAILLCLTSVVCWLSIVCPPSATSIKTNKTTTASLAPHCVGGSLSGATTMPILNRAFFSLPVETETPEPEPVAQKSRRTSTEVISKPRPAPESVNATRRATASLYLFNKALLC